MLTMDEFYVLRLQSARTMAALEDTLRAAQRALPIGAGASPIVARGVDHLDYSLRSGSPEYLRLLEDLKRRGIL